MTGRATTDTGAKRFPWLLTVLTLVALALLLALGSWQVHRLGWKEALVETIGSRIASAPQPLAEVETTFAEGGDIEYVPLLASGTFLHDREQFFFATHEGQSGWYVYTPLAVDGGRFVFVNRGFVPYDRKAASTRIEGQLPGTVELTGLARGAPVEKPSWLVPDNRQDENVYYWKDLAAMTASAALSVDAVLPFFIDASASDVPGGLPVGGVTIVQLTNNHLQYAVTWYGLAAALAGVYIAMILRRRRREDESRP